MATKHTLTRGKIAACFKELNSKEFGKCDINNNAGYWLGRLRDMTQSTAKNTAAQQALISKKYYTEIFDENGKKTGAVEIPADKVDEFKTEIENFLNEKEEVEFDVLDHKLFTKEAGTGSLPASFWNNCGIIFVTEPKK